MWTLSTSAEELAKRFAAVVEEAVAGVFLWQSSVGLDRSRFDVAANAKCSVEVVRLQWWDWPLTLTMIHSSLLSVRKDTGRGQVGRRLPLEPG